MLKRTSFSRKLPERQPLPAPRPVRQVAPTVFAVVGQPKENPVRSEAYRRLVAAMPCCVCGLSGHSQAAHPNTGKGAGLKTDDRLCFALCADSPGRQGCHPKFDQGALFSKEGRRTIELVWAAETRRLITLDGKWPAELPFYNEKPAKALVNSAQAAIK